MPELWTEVPPLRVGDRIYGHCGGAFGDTYEDKRVEAIGGDWVVLRSVEPYYDQRGRHIYSGDPDDLKEYRYPVCMECQSQGPPRSDGNCLTCGAVISKD